MRSIRNTIVVAVIACAPLLVAAQTGSSATADNAIASEASEQPQPATDQQAVAPPDQQATQQTAPAGQAAAPQAPAPHQFLFVDSTPGNAVVYIDGQLVGSTGADGHLRLTSVPYGMHQLRITADGYYDDIEEILFGSESATQVQVVLRPGTKPAVRVAAIPAARVPRAAPAELPSMGGEFAGGRLGFGGNVGYSMIPTQVLKRFLKYQPPQVYGRYAESSLVLFNEEHPDPRWVFSVGYGEFKWSATASPSTADFFSLTGKARMTEITFSRNFNLFVHQWYGAYIVLGGGAGKLTAKSWNTTQTITYKMWVPVPNIGVGVNIRPMTDRVTLGIGTGIHYLYEPATASLLIRF